MKPIASFLAMLCLFQSSFANTAVPDAISYQGRALTAAGALLGLGTPVNRTVTFRIWDHASNSLADNLIYAETQVVTIADGEFSVLVGTGTATGETTKVVKISDAFGGASRYLGVTLDDGTAAVDNEISPRQQIVSGAFSLRSKIAESVDGLAITTAMLANNSVTTTQVNDAAITTSKLAANAVTSTQIEDGSVTTAKLANGNVTTAKIATDTILAGNIAAGAVGTSEIFDGTVASADIATDTILAGNIAAGAVGTSEIFDGTVTSADIALDTIAAVDLAADSVGSSEIMAGAVGTSEIFDGTVTVTDLNFKPSTGEENLRMIRGNVTSAGAVSKGSGFTARKNGTGLYTVTFATPFLDSPSATVVSADGSPAILAMMTDNNTLSVWVYTPAGTGSKDGPFSFIAIGPR